jgi:lipoprotein-anchoring transpeptidase ErfK/SrfK
LDVYLGGTFMLRYPVGLGAESSTPSGEWEVQNKLKNPQYYPPRGGKIILADDPENPLGERWIGLKGVKGEAVGQQRYGIHGTIEPDSIGRSASLGCIRMHNTDVEEFYDLVVVGHTKVTVN